MPTDVEQGGDGWLYVTCLPGGLEDGSLGARGAVYRFNPADGKAHFVAGGFVGATDLAVSKRTTDPQHFLSPHGTTLTTVLFAPRRSE